MLLVWFISSSLLAQPGGVGHQLAVSINPATGTLQIDDIVSFAQAGRRFEFVLNAGFTVSAADGVIEAIATSRDALRVAYRVRLAEPARQLRLSYQGRPALSRRPGHGGMPPGVVGSDYVYLDSASAWFPQFDSTISQATISTTLPEGWQSVSLGRRRVEADKVTWTSTQPADDLYLIAAPFRRYARRHGDVDLSVWLLDDQPALADRYLDVIGGYIDQYGAMIGAYPYPKFAVVENRWQTGYGMPSFTLLGSQVIRLPFIPFTSLPHEILHNWWGNGVWIDYARGNWSEGLTAYLSDHWMQARQGKGAEYRLKALQRYSNFAATGDDMPLLEFVSRHGEASQSVGYGKSLMVFHMLRRALGDQDFVAGLKRLWEPHRYTRIGFRDAIAAIAGQHAELAQRFDAWLSRNGAPRLALHDVGVQPVDGGWQLRFTVEQTQTEPFAFDLPFSLVLEGSESAAQQHVVTMDQATQHISMTLPARPLRLDIDPAYDLLRVLDATEQPAVLSRVLGAREAWLVVPRRTDPALRSAWEALAEAWMQRYPGLRRIDDSDVGELPEGAPRLLLGWDNSALVEARTAFDRAGQRLDTAGATLDDDHVAPGDGGVVLVSSDAAGVTTGFVGAADPVLIGTLARKLPHYTGYGRLRFDDQGRNLLKDTLPSAHSALTRQLGATTVPLRLPARAALGSVNAGD